MRSAVHLLAFFALAGSPALIHAGDWPRFRGPNGSAVSSETGLPVHWSDSDEHCLEGRPARPGKFQSDCVQRPRLRDVL